MACDGAWEGGGWGAYYREAASGCEATARGARSCARFEEFSREILEAHAVDGRMRIEYETRVSFGQPRS